jgi:DNA-binding FadR family transcriptional regulator
MASEQVHRSKDRAPSGLLRFEPIQQQRAHEYVAEQIRRHIALRLIKPGESLPPERDLAGIFAVGRPTIQHALRLLEAEGLVATRRGRGGGTFVADLSQDALSPDELILRVASRPRDFEDLLTYRRIVEPAVAGLAARTREDADVALMRAAMKGMLDATTEPEYMRHDTEFHIAVARATHNRFLIRAIEEIRLGLNDAMTLLPETDSWHRRIGSEHEALVEAIVAGDSAAAGKIMQVHVNNSERSLRAVLHAVLRRGMEVIG